MTKSPVLLISKMRAENGASASPEVMMTLTRSVPMEQRRPKAESPPRLTPPPRGCEHTNYKTATSSTSAT